MVKLRERAKNSKLRNTQKTTRLSDEEVELMRKLYDLGKTMPEDERRRRQLGYKGLAKRFGVPKATAQFYLTYRRRC